MDVNNAMDQYEKQLFSLFTNYDSNHNGNLTKGALQELCNALQLEDRGRQLINLLCKEGGECQVSFQNFRDGLLTVLGDESYDRPTQRKDQHENNSEGDSSGREVSPKYVFGSKKYGRRSRPTYKVESLDLINDNSHGTDTSQFSSYELESISKENKKISKVRRSISLNEGRGSDYYSDINSLDTSRCVTHLSVTRVENIECTSNLSYTDCNSNTQKPSHISVPYDENTNHQLQPLIGNSIEAIANQELDENVSMEDSIPSENIAELWESVGITHPQQLLQDLGFQNRNLKLSQVICVLEEEIKMMTSSVQEPSTTCSLIILFQAIMCLYRCEVKSLKLCLNHTVAERNKLKSDLSDANQRAILLAHEVDENHANMENIMKQNIKSLETKHADIVKQMLEEFSTEKELSSLTISKLDTRLLSLETEEVKLKSQISTLQDDNLKLEKELNKSQEQLFELTDIKNHLTKELKVLGNERQQNQCNPTDEKNILHLENQLAKYQSENTALKDKNDELCTELETIKMKFSTYQPKKTDHDNEEQPLDSFVMHMNPMNSFSSSNDTSSSLISQIDLKIDDKDTVNDETSSRNISTDGANPVLICVKTKCQESVLSSVTESNLDINMNNLNLSVNFNEIAVDHIERLLDLIKNPQYNLSDDVLNNTIKPYILCLYAVIKKITLNLKNLLNMDNFQDVDKELKLNLSQTIHKIINEVLDHNHDSGEVDGLSNIVCKYNDTNQTVSSDVHSSGSSNVCKLKEEIASLNHQIENLNECLEKERKERDEEKTKELEKYQELESNMDLLRNEYYKCEEYWSTKLNEEREIFDQEQRITDEKFAELLTKLSEYEEQFTAQDNKTDRFGGPLSTIEEKCHLEKQFNDLEDEFEQYKINAEKEGKSKDFEISELKEKMAKLEESLKNTLNTEKNLQNSVVMGLSNKEEELKGKDIHDGPISNRSINPSTTEKDTNYINSPINYLWSQKTIPSPIINVKCNSESQRDYQNPAYIKESQSENTNVSTCVAPIQKPISSKMSVPETADENIVSNVLEVKHEAKMLHCSDLEEALQGRRKFGQQIDGNRNKIETDFQTFNMQKPNYQTQNNSSILRTVALEIHCRQLQAALRQQQAYAESVFQQTVAAHRAEMGALKQRLAAADLLVRDLYVENCHLARNINNPLLK